MNASKKGRYHHGDLRKALVDASLAIISDGGPEALTLRSAAREAGVSHAAPYAHFADKEELVAAVKEELFKELERLTLAALRAADDRPAARVRAIADTYLRFAAAQPEKYAVMARPPFTGAGHDLFALFEAEVAALLATHEGRSEFTAEHLAMASWSTLHGFCVLWRGRDNDSGTRLVDYVIRSLEKV